MGEVEIAYNAFLDAVAKEFRVRRQDAEVLIKRAVKPLPLGMGSVNAKNIDKIKRRIRNGNQQG